MMEQVMSNPIVVQPFVMTIYRLFFVFGIIGFAVGIGLVLNHARMHQLFGVMNRWVSVRHSTRLLAIPRDTEALEQRFRHLIGTAFILAAAFSIFIMVTKIDADRLAAVIQLDVPNSFEVWIFESVRWFLIVGSMLAIAAGIMLLLFPNALHAIERVTNHWYSTRRIGRSEEIMHMGFDRWIERNPRIMGWIIAWGSLVVVIDFGILMFQHSWQ